MINVEARGNEWTVVHDGEVVSIHPSRVEAERAARWLNEQVDDDATE